MIVRVKFLLSPRFLGGAELSCKIPLVIWLYKL